MLSLDPTLPSAPPEGGADALPPASSEAGPRDAFEALLAAFVGAEEPSLASQHGEGAEAPVDSTLAHDDPDEVTEQMPASDGDDDVLSTPLGGWQIMPVPAAPSLELPLQTPMPASAPVEGEAPVGDEPAAVTAMALPSAPAAADLALSAAVDRRAASEQSAPAIADGLAGLADQDAPEVPLAPAAHAAPADVPDTDRPADAPRVDVPAAAPGARPDRPATQAVDIAGPAVAVSDAARARASAAARLAAGTDPQPVEPGVTGAAEQTAVAVRPVRALDEDTGSTGPADRERGARAAAAFERMQQAPFTWTDAPGHSGSAGAPGGPPRQASVTPFELPVPALRGDGRKAASALTSAPALLSSAAAAVQHARAAAASAPSSPGSEEPTLERQIVQSLHTVWKGGSGEARLTLKPEYLGHITISVRVEQGAATAVLHVEEPQVRAWVQAHEPLLRQGLSSQGLTLERLTVSDERHPAEGRRRDEEPRRNRRSHRPGSPDETPIFEITG
jgi:hypothetical protein